MKTKFVPFACCILGLVSALIAAVHPAAAQVSTAPANAYGATVAPPSYRRTEGQSATKSINRAIDLPFVPTLPGAKYVSGFILSNQRSGLSAQEKFAAAQDAKTLVAWYASALAGAGWTMEPVYGSTNRLSAVKDGGYSCQVVVSPSNTAQARTLVRIVYHDTHDASAR